MRTDGDYISRADAIEAMYKDAEAHQDHTFWTTQHEALRNIPAANVRPVPEGGIGEMSDGHHTFNGLYYQRMVLFAALVRQNRDRAWKSWKHEDGELCFGGGWFIVGIDTPEGSYTYHYEDKYWNWFECEELPTAKHWDGHTEEDVTRLLSLPDVRPKWISVEERLPEEPGEYIVFIRDPFHGKDEPQDEFNVDASYATSCFYDKDAGLWREGEDNYYCANLQCVNTAKMYYITHWMPLPEPPKEG